MQVVLTSLLLLSSLVTAVIGQFPETCACPDDCVCRLETGVISCDDQGLRHVPIELNSCSWPGIHTLNLSSNFIREIREYSFSLLTNLTRLYIYDNSIELVDRDAFVGLSSLESLFLDGNRIPSLPHQVFRPLRNLQKLLLYDNELTTLPLGIFQQQSELATLALYSNQLTELKTEWFDDTPRLRELYLHDNQISDLTRAPFRSLHYLRVLFLGNNLLTQLTGSDFLGLRRLTMLVLSNNQIATIGNDVFLPTPQLQQLFLESNQLTEVNRLMFAPPVYLEQLRIFNNQISRISNGAFYRLRYLKLLSINDNQISSVTPQTFVGLDSLEELVLHNNQITSLRNDTFVQSPLLQRLWLNSNRISCLESNVFNNLGQLLLLNLGYNQLTHVPDGLFQTTPSMLYLLLNSNRLSSITNKPFANLPSLVQLALTSNPIQYLADGSVSGSNSLYYFQFSRAGEESVFRCDCSTLWLHEWMNARPLLSSVLCGSPEQFSGLDIRTLQTASFGCDSAVLTVEAGPDCDNHVVARGGCLQLTCSSRPRGAMTWTRADGRPIRTQPSSCTFSSSCSQSISGDGTLVLENVTPEDAGYYICSASFRNQTAMQICRVTVSEPPVLHTEAEELYMTSPGPPARFTLNFTGNPRPSVSWYHVLPSGAQVHITETGPSSRYLISDQGSLVILQTQFEDRGTYRAIISNGAGEVTTETELYFFFESPCRSQCLNGGECLQVSYCSCPESYGGRQCESFIGVTEATTEVPPSPTPHTDLQYPTKPTEPTTEIPTTVEDPDYEDESGSGSGSGSGSDTKYVDVGSGDVIVDTGSGSGGDDKFDDYGANLIDDEDYGGLAFGNKKQQRKRSVGVLSPLTPRKREHHRVSEPDEFILTIKERTPRVDTGVVPLTNDHIDESPVYVDRYDTRARMLRFER